jgi:septum formation protein
MSQLPGPIYLASASPRRAELLRQLGVRFELFKMREAPGRARDVDEATQPGEDAAAYVERVARSKASVAGNRMLKREWPVYPVLAADTAVVLGDTIFGKPDGIEEAVKFLTALSGKTHLVYTAIAVHWQDQTQTFVSESKVTFRTLAQEELAAYIATGEPFDKAGGYGIQGLAAAFIKRLEGSYSGVMGLPLYETAQTLAHIGWHVI